MECLQEGTWSEGAALQWGVWTVEEGGNMRTLPTNSQYTGPRGVSPGCEKLAHPICALSKQANICTLKDILNQQRTYV